MGIKNKTILPIAALILLGMKNIKLCVKMMCLNKKHFENTV